MELTDIVVIIPSLEPKEDFIEYVHQLLDNGIKQIVIINDGSGEEYNYIFDKLAFFDQCDVLSYSLNQGKGYALKYAFQHVIKNYPNKSVITVDSDGQHLVEDVLAIANKLLKENTMFLLGERSFTKENTPTRSYLGNRSTSLVFFLLHGVWIRDTQTGLRGFHYSLLPNLVAIEGDRFEYEINVLIHYVKTHKNIDAINISTVYEDNNSQSHYRTLIDSYLILKTIFTSFSKYVFSSLVAAFVDLSISWFLFHFFLHFFSTTSFLRIYLAVAIARIVSLIVNYLMNKHFVFNNKEEGRKSFYLYLILCFLNIFISSLSIYLISQIVNIAEISIKIVVDILLFIVNYQIQKRWIFKGGKKYEK